MLWLDLLQPKKPWHNPPSVHMLSQSPFWVCEELQQVDCKEDIVQLPDIPGCQSENFLNRVDGEFEAAFVSLVTEFQSLWTHRLRERDERDDCRSWACVWHIAEPSNDNAWSRQYQVGFKWDEIQAEKNPGCKKNDFFSCCRWLVLLTGKLFLTGLLSETSLQWREEWDDPQRRHLHTYFGNIVLIRNDTKTSVWQADWQQQIQQSFLQHDGTQTHAIVRKWDT